jgi:enoyl-CoA hydratase
VGPAIAKELIFTSELINADAAKDIRLVNRVIDDDKLMDAALTMARRIAAQPPLAVRFAKRSVNLGMQGSVDMGLQFECYGAAMVMDSEDRKEGMRAFVEKREPRFVGR